MTIIVAFILGLLAGVIPKGIHIHINHKQDQTKVEYNESMAGMLPKEVQEYYHSTNGANKF
jgi:hypothetical protein